MSLENLFNIDKNNLDKEWIEQPKLYFTYAKKLEEAKRDLEEAKAEVDLTAAELSALIRSKPGKYGLEKVTETAIKEALAQQKEYLGAEDAVREARYKVGVLNAAVTALDHRKKALENLVWLHGQNYFSSPKIIDSHLDDETKRSIRKKGRRNGDE